MSHDTQRPIAVVTDSTADIPAGLRAQLGIHSVPLVLNLKDRSWRDGVDITAGAFYDLLRTSEALPTTSQPSIAAFQEVFEVLLASADGIVAVLVSRGISGTLDSALAAAANLPAARIAVIDSGGTSMQLGWPVLAAARAAAAGADFETVAAVARRTVARAHLYFAVGTLDYLYRGGRIGRASHLVGTALNIKPILQFSGGVVQPVTRVRSMRRAMDAMLELVQAGITVGSQAHIAVFHIHAADEAGRMMQRIEQLIRPAELFQTECSPVLGAHAGPGTIGVAYYEEPL